MHPSSLILLLGLLQGAPPQADFEAIRRAAASANKEVLRTYFLRPSEAEGLFGMAENRGGLRSLKVRLIPVPPGWEATGGYWIIFHARQDIEDEHDRVYGFVRSGSGYSIGSEVGEGTPQSSKIKHLKSDVRLIPSESRARIRSELELVPWSGSGALLLRLNDDYALKSAEIDGKPARIVTAGLDVLPPPGTGDVVRAGGMIILWSKDAPKSLKFEYDGVVRSDFEDKIASNAAYLTAWWTPSIARLPHTSVVRITAPENWEFVSEGVEVKPEAAGFEPKAPSAGEKTKAFRCDVPISYPKVVGGLYKLAAEAKDAKGRAFRSFQFEPLDKARAERDVALMQEAVAFYEKTLGPFPFPGYACYDADTYYGIESYSYCLLRKDITTAYITHEMGHTYFGGLAPSAYVKDSWNEGVTQYVDSVVFRNSQDRTLQMALRSLGVRVPLAQMPVAHSYGSTTYYRGAYALKMLEAEMGQEKVLAALAEIATTRQGQETTWLDLRAYFEKHSRQDLKWFWSQWVEGAEFPSLRIVRAQLVPRDGKFSTFVTVEQTGTYRPFRLRFKVKLSWQAGILAEREFELRGNRDEIRIDTDRAPIEAVLDPFPLTLASVGPAVAVKP